MRRWWPVLLVAAAAALWGMEKTTPNYNRLLAPIESRGETGTFVRGRSLAVRVDGIEVARSLVVQRLGSPRTLDTGGVWLIVHATASGVDRPVSILGAAIETADGAVYRESDRLFTSRGLLSSQTLQADVPTSGDIIFELPASALTGAEILLSDRILGLGPLDSALRIRLPLDPTSVARVLAAAGRRDMAGPS